MNKRICSLLWCLLLWCGLASAQKSSLQTRAEAADAEGSIAPARSLYIHAFNEYASKGQTRQAAECGVKAVALYYKENYYKEAFDLLRRVDQAIVADQQASAADRSAMRYLTTKERMQMYMKLRKSANAMEQLAAMESHAGASGDEQLKNDLLYNKAICYYTFGQNRQGDAVFHEMAAKLTAEGDYDKVDEVYRTLIANGQKSNSAGLVAQSYGSYMAWKDSVSAVKAAAEVGALKQHIAELDESIAQKDSSLSTRRFIIVALCILAGVLAAVLALGALVLLRYILLTRKQKKTIQLANDNNALKAKFISNISAQLEPTLKKLDSRQPEVRALLDFSAHVQTLSELENSAQDKAVELEETQIPQFSEQLVEQIRGKVKPGVALTVNAPKMSAKINREYVSHILLHLLNGAAEHTPADGKITLDYKKRGAHTHQFLVTDSGPGVAPERQEDVFKPFLEIRDLTTGDGLGLPICKLMAQKMGGDLTIDPAFTRGARFVLNLHE